MAEYANSRQISQAPDAQQPKLHNTARQDAGERKASVLLLEIRAAADYFTANKELMANPPPVMVDLILDPYLLNLVPQSLLPTAAYIVLVAVVTWVIAQKIAGGLLAIGHPKTTHTKKAQ